MPAAYLLYFATHYRMVPHSIHITLEEQSLMLLPQKAVFLQDQRILVISDVHFGKAAHFRSKGIALPQTPERHDLALIQHLIEHTKAQKVVFLGDLFHSKHQHMVVPVTELIREFAPQCPFILVEGNHDIMHESVYKSMGIHVVNELQVGPLVLTHEPVAVHEGINICGHIHPAVRLATGSRQTTKLPCFLISKTQLLMPAFGRLTGLYAIQPKAKDSVYVVVGDKVMAIQ